MDRHANAKLNSADAAVDEDAKDAAGGDAVTVADMNRSASTGNDGLGLGLDRIPGREGAHRRCGQHPHSCARQHGEHLRARREANGDADKDAVTWESTGSSLAPPCSRAVGRPLSSASSLSSTGTPRNRPWRQYSRSTPTSLASPFSSR